MFAESFCMCFPGLPLVHLYLVYIPCVLHAWAMGYCQWSIGKGVLMRARTSKRKGTRSDAPPSTRNFAFGHNVSDNTAFEKTETLFFRKQIFVYAFFFREQIFVYAFFP